MKTLSQIIILILIFSTASSQESKMNVAVNLPDTLRAGEEANFILTFKKPDIRSFAVYEQEFPGGITISATNTKEADFSFADNKLSLSWIRLPKSNKFSITLKIKVDKNLKGEFTTYGNLTYLFNNHKGLVNSDTSHVRIFPVVKEKNKETKKQIKEKQEKKNNSIKTEKKKVVQKKNKKDIKTGCNRVISQVSRKKGSTYIVSLFFMNYNKIGSARITEIVPKGYKIKVLNAGNSTFTVVDQNLICIWDKMPEKESLTLSYELSTDTKKGKPEIRGEFSYAKNNEIKTLFISQP